jgi:flagellar basal body-associated protein FliL
VTNEEIAQIKKNKNKRDLFIFLGVVLTLVLIGLLIYKLIKRKKTTTVVVNS